MQLVLRVQMEIQETQVQRDQQAQLVLLVQMEIQVPLVLQVLSEIQAQRDQQAQQV